MELTVLGSGTGIPSPRRGSPGYLLRGSGATVLVDCGPGSLREAAAAGAGPGEIDAVLLSHLHPDHCLDLAALLFALRSPGYEGRPPLEVVGPAGVRALLDHWRAGPVGGWLRKQVCDVAVREIGEGEHRVGPLLVTAVGVAHTEGSLAYRIREREGGPVLAYSGDSALCDGVVRAGRGADLFLLECSVPDDEPFGAHLTPTGAAEVAERADPARLVLTHFYPSVEGAPIVRTVRRRFRGRVERAEDGATYRV